MLTRTLLLLMLAGLVTPSSATAQVRDQGAYFSAGTVQKADQEIAAIKKDTGKDLLVETFLDIPASKKGDFRPDDKDAREAFFKNWARERAEAAHVNGVYVLLCKNAKRIQVHVDPDTEKKTFSVKDRGRLRDILIARFGRDKFDEGLLEGVSFVHKTLKGQKDAGPTGQTGPKAIRDNGGFFSAEASSKGEALIAAIKRQHHKDVVVETFQNMPAGESDFGEWARRRARAQHVNGIDIVICRQHHHFEVMVAPDIRKIFTDAHRAELINILKKNLSSKNNDEALIESVSYIQKTMNAGPVAHPGEARRGEAPTNWGGLLCTLLVVGGLIWVVVGMIRAFSGGGGGGFGGGGGGGGGFMTGLLGGLFGAMAGNWLYHSFFGGGSSWGSSSAHGGDTSSDTGGDYTSSGSDYDSGSDDSGGGDYGGGDSGGGDYGGGDYGGGDYGGGGGDY